MPDFPAEYTCAVLEAQYSDARQCYGARARVQGNKAGVLPLNLHIPGQDSLSHRRDDDPSRSTTSFKRGAVVAVISPALQDHIVCVFSRAEDDARRPSLNGYLWLRSVLVSLCKSHETPLTCFSLMARQQRILRCWALLLQALLYMPYVCVAL